jgi:hypothetical protein
MSSPYHWDKAIEALQMEVLKLHERLVALEAKQPEPLTFPPIDLGMIGGE